MGHRIRRALGALLLLAAGAACADRAADNAAAGNDPSALAPDSADASPPSAEAVVNALVTMPSEGLWPGFSPRVVPVALFDGERTLLVSHPSPPPGFSPHPTLPGVFVQPGRHPAVRGNMPTEIGGVRTAAVLLDQLPGMPPERAAAVVVHERFHVHQLERHPEWTTNELSLFVYPATDVQQLFDRRLETLALYRAMQAANLEQSECWLRTALLVRRKRMRELPQAVAAFERGIERQEGLARYIERRAAGLRTPIDIPPHDFPPEDVRGRGYMTGETLALMLDRYSPDWKEQVESATDDPPPALDSLLWAAIAGRPEMSCGFSAAERADVIERAIDAVDAIRAQRDSAIARFEAQPGWTIRVVAEGGPLWPQSFDPMSITRVGDATLLHERMLRAGNEQGYVDVFGARALSIGFLDDPLASGMREVRVAGISQRPAIASGEDIRVRIVAEGVELSFQNAHAEEVGQEIVVRLR